MIMEEEEGGGGKEKVYKWEVVERGRYRAGDAGIGGDDGGGVCRRFV